MHYKWTWEFVEEDERKQRRRLPGSKAGEVQYRGPGELSGAAKETSVGNGCKGLQATVVVK